MTGEVGVDGFVEEVEEAVALLGAGGDSVGRLPEDFDAHPYADIVAEAAEIERMRVGQFRRAVLGHQLRLTAEHPEKSRDPEYGALKLRIQAILS